VKCPRDGGTLDQLGPEGTFGQRCGRCRGVLLFEKQFMRRTGHAPEQRLAVAAGLATLRNLPEGDCTCPRDGQPMRLLKYHGVEIDICPACHSVWVDDGEQAKIHAPVRKQRVADAIDRSVAQGRETAGDTAVEAAGDGIVEFVFEALGSICDGI
jgi:Zn-finger nucleic acid-binding protein